MMIKLLTCISISFLCLVLTHCNEYEENSTVQSISIADLRQPIVSAYAFPMDSLQEVMNEVQAMMRIAKDERHLQELANSLNQSQQAFQVILNRLKENPNIGVTSRSEIENTLKKDILSGIGGISIDQSNNKSKTMRVDCVSKYKQMRELALSHKNLTKNAESQILLVWFISELEKTFKDPYFSKQKVNISKIDIRNAVKGKLINDHAEFELDPNKRYLVYLTSSQGTYYCTYANESGLTAKPTDNNPVQVRASFYLHRLIEDCQRSEKTDYKDCIDETAVNIETLTKAIKKLNAISPIFEELEKIEKSLGNSEDKVNLLKQSLSKIEEKKNTLESKKNSILLDIKNLESQLK